MHKQPTTIHYKIKKLALCVLLDAMGMVSFTLPLVGEFSDVIWAPIAAFISYKMFGQKRGKFTALTTFTEEILPFIDVIPSFTIFSILFDWMGVGNPKNTPPLRNK